MEHVLLSDNHRALESMLKQSKQQRDQAAPAAPAAAGHAVVKTPPALVKQPCGLLSPPPSRYEHIPCMSAIKRTAQRAMESAQQAAARTEAGASRALPGRCRPTQPVYDTAASRYEQAQQAGLLRKAAEAEASAQARSAAAAKAAAAVKSAREAAAHRLAAPQQPRPSTAAHAYPSSAAPRILRTSFSVPKAQASSSIAEGRAREAAQQVQYNSDMITKYDGLLAGYGWPGTGSGSSWAAGQLASSAGDSAECPSHLHQLLQLRQVHVDKLVRYLGILDSTAYDVAPDSSQQRPRRRRRGLLVQQQGTAAKQGSVLALCTAWALQCSSQAAVMCVHLGGASLPVGAAGARRM